MRKVLFFTVLALLAFSLFGSFFWFYQVRFMTSRAYTPPAQFSPDNSYVFMSPLRAKANNDEKIRVTVFVLNSQGLGVQGRVISLSAAPGVTTEAVQGITDGFGKAYFDISSSRAGEYYLDVHVDQSILPQKAHLSFY